MPSTKKFHLGDILSITIGRLVSPRHMEGVYDILNYMTGESLSTHQLPRVYDECKPHLLEQMPWLDEIKDDPRRIRQKPFHWLDEQVARYGEMHEVRPLKHGEHVSIDPIQEAAQLMGDPKKAIAVIALDDQSDN